MITDLLSKMYLRELKNTLEIIHEYSLQIEQLKHKLLRIYGYYPFIIKSATNEQIHVTILKYQDQCYFIKQDISRQIHRIHLNNQSTLIESDQHSIRNKLNHIENTYMNVKNKINFTRELVIGIVYI